MKQPGLCKTCPLPNSQPSQGNCCRLAGFFAEARIPTDQFFGACVKDTANFVNALPATSADDIESLLPSVKDRLSALAEHSTNPESTFNVSSTDYMAALAALEVLTEDNKSTLAACANRYLSDNYGAQPLLPNLYAVDS